MNTEEKAKAYDELLVKLQEAKVDDNVCDERYCCVIDEIVPELKESEDEKMANIIREALANVTSENTLGKYGLSHSDVSDWLGEQKAKYHDVCDRCIRQPTCQSDCFLQQGEQKPANMVEPKFHVGDKVKRKDNPHLTYILKRLTDDGDYEFHAIGKDGHEGCTCFAGVKYQDEWELVEQKPAEWSEEDERIHQCLIRDQEKALDDVRNDKYGHSEIISDLKEMYRERINWLESLKDRVQPQNTWKPSDEQMKALYDSIPENVMEISEREMLLNELYKDLRKEYYGR